mmetsp:Transcript_19247/g.23741  ORF Transcript_19247/g.23741 Transcript_19247/m.23741 type:complete len:446 (+) Transcript_19247:21-1358(+)
MDDNMPFRDRDLVNFLNNNPNVARRLKKFPSLVSREVSSNTPELQESSQVVAELRLKVAQAEDRARRAEARTQELELLNHRIDKEFAGYVTKFATLALQVRHTRAFHDDEDDDYSIDASAQAPTYHRMPPRSSSLSQICRRFDFTETDDESQDEDDFTTKVVARRTVNKELQAKAKKSPTNISDEAWQIERCKNNNLPTERPKGINFLKGATEPWQLNCVCNKDRVNRRFSFVSACYKHYQKEIASGNRIVGKKESRAQMKVNKPGSISDDAWKTASQNNDELPTQRPCGLNYDQHGKYWCVTRNKFKCPLLAFQHFQQEVKLGKRKTGAAPRTSSPLKKKKKIWLPFIKAGTRFKNDDTEWIVFCYQKRHLQIDFNNPDQLQPFDGYWYYDASEKARPSDDNYEEKCHWSSAEEVSAWVNKSTVSTAATSCSQLFPPGTFTNIY